jgi:hypothetical protein
MLPSPAWRVEGAIRGQGRVQGAAPADRAAQREGGEILGVTKAVADRGGAEGVRKLTGEWPAETHDEDDQGNPTK